MERVQVVSCYTLDFCWSGAARQEAQEMAHKRLTGLIAEAVSHLQPGQAALVQYGPVETRPSASGFAGMIDCTLRVTIEPYRTA